LPAARLIGTAVIPRDNGQGGEGTREGARRRKRRRRRRTMGISELRKFIFP